MDKQKRVVLSMIEDALLDFNAIPRDEVTTSDLQGIAGAKALKIYELVEGAVIDNYHKQSL